MISTWTNDWLYPWHPKGAFYDVSATWLFINFRKGSRKCSTAYRKPTILHCKLSHFLWKVEKLLKIPLSVGCNARNEWSGKQNKNISLAVQNPTTQKQEIWKSWKNSLLQDFAWKTLETIYFSGKCSWKTRKKLFSNNSL